jgi:uncharacterized protein YbjT (DUF2867 family)
VARFAKRGAKVVAGSHADASVVVEATRGADALFVLVPPDLTSTDIRAHYRRFAKASAAAIRENHISHVVHLSSIGADLDAGAGPVLGLHDSEAILAAAAVNIALLRPGYFMENTLWQIGSIRASGQMFTTFNGETRIPMIATRDIAKRAAELLVKRDFEGQKVVELHGAHALSYNEIAEILSNKLDKKVQHVTVSDAQAKEAFVGMGASPHMADLFNEMGANMDAGKIVFKEPRTKENTTPTTYEAFAEQVFKPVFDAAP